MKFIEAGTAEIVMHPVRFKMIRCIKEAQEALFVEQIAKSVKQSPRLVSHHLDVLEDQGLIKSRYEIATAKGSTRGVAVRLCTPTPKLMEVFKDIAQEVPTGR